ncbi:MAG: 16S rRNA (cytosine(1402)-N(4))-methyltransferase RsmH [Pyrinomonadaceae bacterium]|nr:16S rRNA (cytosine(1402)-N(4))-methyltransferase RsmH [Pyrinomonadaceae bacterium]
MPSEVLDLLASEKGGIFVDSTIGMGGHAKAILLSADNTEVIGIDQDAAALEIAKENLKEFNKRLTFIHSNFADIKQVVDKSGISGVDGIIADLGVSSYQLDSERRGFSFRFDAPLDMRMNPDGDIETAAEILERLSEEEIANIIFQYGEERFSRRIARRIVKRREMGDPVKTTFELAELVKRSVKRTKQDRIHPATRTFQALRIAINGELEILEEFIKDSIDLLKKDGRLVIISFHSLEDRIVKRTMQKLAGKCFCPPKFPKCVCGMSRDVKLLTKKPVVASENEQFENPRARSAKLRACQKLK